MDPENPEGIDRKSTEYRRGRTDFNAGKLPEHNPCRPGYYGRLNWYAGYYDTRTNHRLAAVFKRNNMTFP